MNAALIAAILAFGSGLGFGYMWADCPSGATADRRAAEQYQRDDAALRDASADERPQLRLVIGSGGVR